ncbi:MAG: MmgE/PrpD family protein [Rhizobiaceae bacterium]|nr:MmgE/PrpD family protein [Rhizobiaceae bacterium]
MSTRSQQLAEAVVGLDPRDFGEAPVLKAKLCLLDFLGCAFEASDLPASRQAVAATVPAQGGHFIGGRHQVTPADAAFVNAVMGHGLVREDMHAPSVCHHGVVVWPLLLALAESAPVNGLRLLQGAIVAYEVGGRLGRMAIDPAMSALYRPTGLIAPIGAATGGSWMLGFDADQIASGIAIAANTSSGLNQWPGTGASDMYFHPGFAARNAWSAVRLAGAGAFASPDILEGPAGFFAAFARRPMPGPIRLFPGGEADILTVYHKAAPACNFAQTACQTALKLTEMLGPDAAPVRSIRIDLPEAAARYPGCDGRGPFERSLQAKMSIPFGVAAVLVHRRLAEANYRDLDNAEVNRLAAATELSVNPELTAAFPGQQGAMIELTLEDERRLSIGQTNVTPATEGEVRQRFREAASVVVGAAAADAIEGFVDTIETSADAGQLARLCALTAAGDRTQSSRRKPAASGVALHRSNAIHPKQEQN